MQWQAPKIPVIPQQDGGEQRQENYPEPQNPRNQPGLSQHVHQQNQNGTCLIKVKKGEPFSEVVPHHRESSDIHTGNKSSIIKMGKGGKHFSKKSTILIISMGSFHTQNACLYKVCTNIQSGVIY